MFARCVGFLMVLITISGCATILEKRTFPTFKPLTEEQARARAAQFLRKIGRGSSYSDERLGELLGKAEYKDTYGEPRWEFRPLL